MTLGRKIALIGFYVPVGKFHKTEFRTQIVKILRKMGRICTDILNAFEG